MEHRKELDKPLTKGACFAFWEKLSVESFEDQQAMVDNAVMGGYPMLVKLNKETGKGVVRQSWVSIAALTRSTTQQALTKMGVSNMQNTAQIIQFSDLIKDRS